MIGNVDVLRGTLNLCRSCGDAGERSELGVKLGVKERVWAGVKVV